MADWRVVVQLDAGAQGGTNQCERVVFPGATLPARISVVACDNVSLPLATSVHGEILRQLQLAGGVGSACHGPGAISRVQGMTLAQCQAWSEPSCRHVLVLVIGSAPLDPAFEFLASTWRANGGAHSAVIPALLPHLAHGQVFHGGGFKNLSVESSPAWNGSPAQLARIALSRAMLEERPGIFLSYRRDEASAVADDIHDALTHSGFRVYLDRFSGQAGLPFPHQIAEAMSDMGMVVLLETPRTARSSWTMTEVAFAHRYHLGPVAVNFSAAPHIARIDTRLDVAANPSRPLPKSDIAGIVGFIEQRHLATVVSRRAYFETLIHLAATSKGGGVRNIERGVLALDSSTTKSVAHVLPCAAPGRLRHVARLRQTLTTGTAVLAGEHENLPTNEFADLKWLAHEGRVTLVGSASVYAHVRGLL